MEHKQAIAPGMRAAIGSKSMQKRPSFAALARNRLRVLFKDENWLYRDYRALAEKRAAKSGALLAEAKKEAAGQIGAEHPDYYCLSLARNKALKAAALDKYNCEALLLAGEWSTFLGDSEQDARLKEKEYGIARRCFVLAPMALGDVEGRDPKTLAGISISLYNLSMKTGNLEYAEGNLWCAFFHLFDAIVKNKGDPALSSELLGRLQTLRAKFQGIFMQDKSFDEAEAIRRIPKILLNGDCDRNTEVLMGHAREQHALRLENRAYYPAAASLHATKAIGADPESQVLHALLGEAMLLQGKPRDAFFAYLDAAILHAKAGKGGDFSLDSSPFHKKLAECAIEYDGAIADSQDSRENALRASRAWARHISGQNFEARVAFGDLLSRVPKSRLANEWLGETRKKGPAPMDASAVFNGKQSAYI